MNEKCCLLLGIILLLTIVSESRVIVPRALPDDEPSGRGKLRLSMNPFERGKLRLSMNPFEKDKKSGLKDAIWGPPTLDDEFNVHDYDTGVNGPRIPPFDNDKNKPGRGVNRIDNNLPGTNPERLPFDVDREERQTEENDDINELGDENFIKPLDEEDSDKSDIDNKDLESLSDEDKPIIKDSDESEVGDTDSEDFGDKENKPENNDTDEEEPGEDSIDDENEDDEMSKKEEEELDEERIDEEGNPEPEDNDKKKYGPDEGPVDDEDEEEENPKEDDEEGENPKGVNEEPAYHEEDDDNDDNVHEEGEPGLFSGGSIFDTPFFNLVQVKKYFSQLERALGNIFRQTLDEARLLNGTYANTTEEEVDINGKKYIITKSIIKGADKHHSLYVESLSSKPKMNNTEIKEGTEIKNATHT